MSDQPIRKKRMIMICAIGVLWIICTLEPGYAGKCGQTHCNGFAPWTADSPAFADVNHCVNTCAAHGDAIYIPAGTATWSGTLMITKDVKLIGAGQTKTVIQADHNAGTGVNCHNGSGFKEGACLICFKPSAETMERLQDWSNPGMFEISGITFHILNWTSDGRSIALYAWTQASTPIRNFKIHDNTFINVSKSIYTIGNIWGVFYRNTLHDSTLMSNLGKEKASWGNYPFAPGGADNMFFEDNTITGKDRTAATIHAGSGHGGRYLLRYNTINDYNYGQIFEWHGNQSGDIHATMGVEIYGNLLNNLSSTLGGGVSVNMRGGQGLIFNNHKASGPTNLSIQAYEEAPNGTRTGYLPHATGINTITIDTYASGYADYLIREHVVVIKHRTAGVGEGQRRRIVDYVPSTGLVTIDSCWDPPITAADDVYYVVDTAEEAAYNQTLNQTYVFGNHNGTTLLTGVTNNLGSPGQYFWITGLHENSNYWVSRNYGAFDGTEGIGCGSYSSMRAIAACSDGVGFWVPNAAIDPSASSCSDLTGYTGANNTLAASVNGNVGTLYRCVNNAWEAYYTPYTYPHPLRAGDDLIPPAAPAALTVN